MNTSGSNSSLTSYGKLGRWLTLAALPMLMVSGLAYGDIPIVNQKPHRGLEKQPSVPSDIGVVQEIYFLLAKVDKVGNVPAPLNGGGFLIKSDEKFNLQFKVFHAGKKATGQTGVPDLKAHYVIMCGGAKKLDNKKPLAKPNNNDNYTTIEGPFEVKNGGKSNLACTFSVTVEAAPGTPNWTENMTNNTATQAFVVLPK